MCFSDDDTGPDIYLATENGYYIPAPPMVYIPGQRRAQRQLQRKARRSHAQPNQVSQPLNSQTAPSERFSMPVSNPSPALSVVTGPHLHVTTFQSDCNPAREPQSSEILSEKPAPKPAPKPATKPSSKPAAKLAGPSPGKQPKNAGSANASIPDAIHRAESSSSSNVPSGSTASVTSSLRSILKKSPSLRPEDSVSNVGLPQAGARDTSKHEMENRGGGKSKTRKSVSFLGKTGPLESLPMAGRASAMGAAEEGAAIAKMLVAKEKASRRRSTALKSNSSDGGTDGSKSQSSRIRSVVSHGGETRNSGKEREAGRQTGAWYDKLLSTSRDAPHMVQQVLSDDDQNSDTDDEVVGRWP